MHNPALAQGNFTFRCGEMMFYAGITINGRIDFYIVRNGTQTERRYRDEISRPIVSCAAAIRDKFILIDDSCLPFRAYLVEDFLFEQRMIKLEW